MTKPALWFREGFAGPRAACRPRAARPTLDPGEQRQRCVLILGLEEGEVVAVGPVVVVVVDGRDAHHDLAGPAGEEQLDAGVIEERVPAVE